VRTSGGMKKVTGQIDICTQKARKTESNEMARESDVRGTTAYANVNLKLTEEEKWTVKEWCVHHRMTQVGAFREAFDLLQAKHAREDRK
jgi:hypothetical protein